MKQIYDITLVKGYPVITDDKGTRLFLDSTAPSFCATDITLNSRSFGANSAQVKQFFRGVKEKFGDSIDGLLGKDIIGKFDILLTKTQLTLSDEPLAVPDSEVILQTQRDMVAMKLNNNSVKLVMDTGGLQTMIADRSFVNGCNKVDEYEDTHPNCGNFTVGLFDAVLDFGDFTLDHCRIGILPEYFRSEFRRAGITGTLGLDILEHGDIHLNYSKGIFGFIPKK